MDERKVFEQKVLTYQSRIYRAIAKYVSDACTVEDLVQDTFIKAWLHRESYRANSAYSTWLIRIAINTALNWLVSEKRKPRCVYDMGDFDELSIDTGDFAPLNIAISDQEVAKIHKAINGLPESVKNTVVLYVIYGLAYQEIADSQDIPIGTVRSRLARGRFYLNKLLNNP